MKCSKLLGDTGYEVVEAKTGVEALEKYKEFKPDGVLLDIIMPEMHGITALKEIKKIDPVVLSISEMRHFVCHAPTKDTTS